MFADGGARGNPGPAAAAFVVYDDGGKVVGEGGDFIGEATNNVAEYKAVILAMKWILDKKRDLGPGRVDFYLDSQLVVRQLNGDFKIKSSTLLPLAAAIKKAEQLLKVPVSFSHVGRDNNKMADSLVNEIIDKKLGT